MNCDGSRLWPAESDFLTAAASARPTKFPNFENKKDYETWYSKGLSKSILDVPISHYWIEIKSSSS